jgi:hypothetical protein
MAEKLRVTRNQDANHYAVEMGAAGGDSIRCIVAVVPQSGADQRTEEERHAAAKRKARALAQAFLDALQD